MAASALRRSWIHEGSGVYTGPLVPISLGRGTPGFFGPGSSPSEGGAAPSIGAEPIPYPPAAGLPKLLALIAAYVGRQHGLAIAPEEVVVCNGGTNAIYTTVTDLNRTSRARRLRCGFLTPTWLALPWNQVTLLGGAAVEISSTFAGSRWEPDASYLEILALQKSLDTLFLVNPGNPTGSLLEGASKLFPLLFDRGISCILDITYDAMVYDPGSPPILPEDRRHLFIVGSLSKTFAAPGIRVGFLIPPRTARETCIRIVENLSMGVSVPSQEDAIRLLEHWQETHGAGFGEIMNELRARREVTTEMLGQCGFDFAIPKGAYYVFARLPASWTGRAEDFARALKAQTGVDVIPGTDFGSSYDSFVRISFANPPTREALIDSLGRIARFVEAVSPQRKEEAA